MYYTNDYRYKSRYKKRIKNEVSGYFFCNFSFRLFRRVFIARFLSDDSFQKEEVFRLLFKQIDLLPERCREIFLLHLEGYDNDAIAKKLSLSIETVKTQKKRAMKTLRK